MDKDKDHFKIKKIKDFNNGFEIVIFYCFISHSMQPIMKPSNAHCFQNRTGPGGRTVKTGNRDENRFFKPKEPDFLLIP